MLDDLDAFLADHRAHGAASSRVSDPTPNGYRVEVACPCGVTFDRWIAPVDAASDLLTLLLRAERN